MQYLVIILSVKGEFVKKFFLISFLLFISCCFANGGQEEIVERMPNLVIQLGLIIFAARLGAIIFEKFKIPGVLGELFIGIIIGPFLLGGLPLYGFPHGIFGSIDPGFPIQAELYGISIVASIILLFLSGLETDIDLFIKFSFAGTIIGISGIVFSFMAGALTAMYFLHIPFSDPKCLFLGIMSTATSVGITARILSERKKTDTPEGVTIMAGAVIDDVLGVILLAIVMGMALLIKSGGTISWKNIGLLAFKEIGIWLGVTLIGLYFAHKIGRFLKGFKNHIVFSVLAFSIALIIAGLFERAGLAMIIGAYVVGFTLSKTEIRFKIQEALHPLKIFFVPIFFTVMGMMVDVRTLFTKETVIFGAIYTIGAIVSKFLGCAIPSLFLNFNWEGAKRIGLGMIPRGEVALIIAGIGLSYGFLYDQVYDLFSIAILMTLVTTMISPPLLNLSLKNNKSGVKNEILMPEIETIKIHIPDPDLLELLLHKLIYAFKDQFFFVSISDHDEDHFQIRKNETNIVLGKHQQELTIQTDKHAMLLAKRIAYESIDILKSSMNNLQHIKHQIFHLDQPDVNVSLLNTYLKYENFCILESDSKEDAIWELLQMLKHNKSIQLSKNLYQELIKKEEILNTGYKNHFALPNIISDQIDSPILALGYSVKGIDFSAFDNMKSHLIFLLISPEKDASIHILLLSKLTHLSENQNVKDAIKKSDYQSIIRILELNT